MVVNVRNVLSITIMLESFTDDVGADREANNLPIGRPIGFPTLSDKTERRGCLNSVYPVIFQKLIRVPIRYIYMHQGTTCLCTYVLCMYEYSMYENSKYA